MDLFGWLARKTAPEAGAGKGGQKHEGLSEPATVTKTKSEAAKEAKEQTTSWYEDTGWLEICKWVTELSGRPRVDSIYIQQFDIIPPGMDLVQLCALFNEDSQNWKMGFDEEGEVVIRANARG